MNNINETIEKLKELLGKNESLAYARDCLDLIKNKEIIFHPGTDLAPDHAYKTYLERKNLQDHVTNARVEGYESLLLELEKNLAFSKRIRILKIISDYVYLIFADTELNELFGILFSQESNIKKHTEMVEDNRPKGIKDNTVRMINGVVA